MDKFYIITNRDKDQNLRFTEEIVQYLKEHGKSACAHTASAPPGDTPENVRCSRRSAEWRGNTITQIRL